MPSQADYPVFVEIAHQPQSLFHWIFIHLFHSHIFFPKTASLTSLFSFYKLQPDTLFLYYYICVCHQIYCGVSLLSFRCCWSFWIFRTTALQKYSSSLLLNSLMVSWLCFCLFKDELPVYLQFWCISKLYPLLTSEDYRSLYLPDATILRSWFSAVFFIVF